MPRIWQWIIEFFHEWQAERDRQIEHQIRAHDRASQSLDVIKDAATVDTDRQEALNNRAGASRKRGKELGLSILLGLAVCGVVTAQDAETRIRTLGLPDLRVYAQELVDHAREQQAIIDAQQLEIEELTQRLQTVDDEVRAIRQSIEELRPTRQRSGWGRVMDWTLRALPIALGVIAASR
jgi:FtsZ-binding cell division protein ZapB